MRIQSMMIYITFLKICPNNDKFIGTLFSKLDEAYTNDE